MTKEEALKEISNHDWRKINSLAASGECLFVLVIIAKILAHALLPNENKKHD